MSRKRKLYLSEFLNRYIEDEQHIKAFEIFPKNKMQYLCSNIHEVFNVIEQEDLDSEIDYWETYNDSVFVILK